MKVNYKILFYTWLLLIFLLAIIPFKTANYFEINSKMHRIDYFEHFLVFGIAGLLNVLKEDNLQKKNFILTILKWFIILSIFAFILELVQIFVPLRTLNIKDFLYNIYGLSIGTIFPLLYIFFKKLLNNKLL